MATTEKTDEITEAAMLAALAPAGETPPSSGQLKRWRRVGLLPRPRVEHRAGVKGSQSWYPVWASEQLLVIVRLHQSTHRLGELCTALWWEGRWVDPSALRKALLAPLDRFSAAASKARGGQDDPYEAADEILRTMPDDGKASTMVTMMRSRLNGPADFLDLMWTFLVVGLGGQAPWEQEDCSRPDPAPGALQLLVSATGIDRAMRDKPAGRAPWLPEDFDPRSFIAELRDAGGLRDRRPCCSDPRGQRRAARAGSLRRAAVQQAAGDDRFGAAGHARYRRRRPWIVERDRPDQLV